MGSCACFLIFALLCFPAEMLAASAKGVQLWLTKVFPPCFRFWLPAVSYCALVRHSGWVRLCALLMQPFVSPAGYCRLPLLFSDFFRYPMGAKLTAQLYEQRQLSSPMHNSFLPFPTVPYLFLIGTVGVGFFGMPAFGICFGSPPFSAQSPQVFSFAGKKIRSHLSFCFRSFLPNCGRGAFRFCCGCTSHHSD